MAPAGESFGWFLWIRVRALLAHHEFTHQTHGDGLPLRERISVLYKEINGSGSPDPAQRRLSLTPADSTRQEAEMRTLSKTELTDILNGAAILGSGGGGPKDIGQQAIDYIMMDPSKQIHIADPEEDVGDKQLMAVSAAVGSPAAAQDFPLDVAGLAFRNLNEQQNGELDFVLPGEVGAGNSFIPMVVAFDKGIPMVDASGASRAIPTLTQCTYAANDLPISPLVLANNEHKVTMNIMYAKEAEGPMRAVISTKEFGMVAGIAFWTMTGEVMKKNAIEGTLTMAQKLGATLREALERHADPVEAVRAHLHGYLLICGTVIEVMETTEGGFDFGRVLVKSSTGEIVTIYNQNENLIAWSSERDRPLAIGPDLVCYLTPEGETFSNATVEQFKGKEIAVIGAPATPKMRGAGIVEAFRESLGGLGYAGPYVKIEDLQGEPALGTRTAAN